MKTGSRRLAVDTLRAAVAGRISRAAGREAVYRMLADSEERLTETASPPEDAALAAACDAALRLLPPRLAEHDELRERAAATAERLEEIARVSPAEGRSRAAGLAPADRRAVVEALIRRADEVALDEPSHAIVLAGVAVSAAEAANPRGWERRDHDLRAAARRALAEAAYRSGDLLAADGALAEAKRLARGGTLDPVLRADLLRLEAEIRSDQSRFGEACRLARRSLRLLRHAGETRREARGRLSLAIKLECDGRLAEALAENEAALRLIDAERDGRWVLAAEFNRAHWLNDAGDTAAARAALPRLADLAARHGRVTDRVRLDWLAARIAAQEGDLERALEIYRPVLDRCLELETVHDSALAALELAVVLLRLGRADEVLPLADTVAPIFRAQGVEPEAAAAVLLAAESLRRGVAATDVLLALHAARARARGTR
jgi:tetratricopeptide (TPR) repeat protein